MVPEKIVPLSHCPQVAAEYGVGLFESAYAIKGGSVTKVKIVEMANARSFSTHYEILSCYFSISWRLSLSYVQKKMPIGVSLSFCVIYKCMTNSRKYHLFCFSVFRKKAQSFLICHRFRNLDILRSENDNIGADIIFSFCCKDITGTSTYLKNAQTNGNENFKNTFHNINNSFLSLF